MIALSLLAALAAPSALAADCYVDTPMMAYATFGDNTQTQGGAGSVDDPAAALYAMPALFLANAATWWGNGVANTDQIIADAARPFVLQGYTPFDYELVDAAYLRFDVFYWSYSNTEGLGVMDEDGSYSSLLWNYAYFDDLQTALQKHERDYRQWVSIRLDLLTGEAFAWEIDAFGNPTYDYGVIGKFGDHAWDQGDLYYVLKLAGDGDLYGLLYDDVALGYVDFFAHSSKTNVCIQ